MWSLLFQSTRKQLKWHELKMRDVQGEYSCQLVLMRRISLYKSETRDLLKIHSLYEIIADKTDSSFSRVLLDIGRQEIIEQNVDRF